MKRITFLLFVSLLSLCSYAQGLENESFEGVFPPPGWAVFQNNVGTGTVWTQNPLNNSTRPPHTGLRAAFMERQNAASVNPMDYLATPSVEIPASPQLRFWSRLTIANDQGTIYQIMVKPVSAGAQNEIAGYQIVQTWTELQINPGVQEEYVQKVVNIPAEYVGQNVYVAFVMTSALNNGDRWLVDDVDIVTECLAPTTPVATNVGLNNATLSWANPSNATSFQIEIKPQAAAFDGTGLITHNGAPSYIATLPESGTDYKYRVRAVCGPGNESPWSTTTNFSTVALGESCNAPIVVTLPYSTTDNTANYADLNYEGSPGATGCGTTNAYLNGNDVVYAYTATTTGVISINMNNTGTFAGLFVYNSCANIGVSCVAGGTGNTTTPVNIPSLSVTAGTTYYIVISTWATPQTTPYTLTIQAVNCPPPTNLAAANVNATSAGLSWNANGASSWQVVVQTAGAGIPQGAGTTVSTNANYVVTQTTAGVVFTPATSYEYYVRADCNDGTGNFSAWAGPFAFTTTQIPVTLPYTQDFETAPSGFTLSNGTQANKWVIGTAVNNGGTSSLYVSDDNGVTNNYNISSASVVHAYRDLQMPANVDQINVSYDWRALGESCCDYLRVWMVPASFNPTPGTQIAAAADRVQIGGNQNGNASFTTVNAVVNAAAYAGQVRRLIFEWRNDGSIGPVPPAAVDNINVSVITCSAPSALTLGAVGETTATVNWTAPASAPAGYDYYLSTTNTAPTANTVPTGNVTPATANLTLLSPSTNYNIWVRSNCGEVNGTSFWIGPLNFNTTQIPVSLNYTEGFEATHGWTFINGTQPNIWVVGNAVNNGGTNSMYISNDNGVTNAYTITTASTVQAYRDIQIPAGANEVSVSFDWKSQGETNDYFRVWFVPVTFTPTAGTQITAANSGGQQIGGNYLTNNTFTTVNNVVNTTAYAGQVRRLVFEWRNNAFTGTQPPAAVDNINVSVVTCSAPSALTLGTVGETTANISWTAPASGAASYDYYLSTSSTAPVAGTAPTGNFTAAAAPLANLNNSTTYYFWVRSNCGEANGTSFWVGPLSFNTTQVAAPLPYTQDFEGVSSGFTLNNGTQVNKWVVGTAVSNSPTHSLYISNDNGLTNSYTINSTSVVHAYRDLAIPTGTTDVNLAYDWRALGESCCDYIRVWLVPATFTPTPGTQITAGANRLQLGGNQNNNANWTTVNTIFNASAYAGGTMRLVFEWRNDGSVGTPPAGGIDNIAVTAITCPQPTNLVVTDTQTYGAIINWTNQGTATSWEVYIVPTGQPAPTTGTTGVVVTAPTYTAVLDPSTAYTVYVRAICSESDKSLWTGPVNFETDPLCPEPVNINVSCLSQEGGSITWDAGATETAWEVVVLPATAPMPASGTPVTNDQFVTDPLIVGSDYTVYVRAVCTGEDGFSSWAEYDFTAPQTSPADGEAFCAGVDSVPVDNVDDSSGDDGYGQIGCLFTTPNPVWYYLTIDEPGNMAFQLVQNTAFNGNTPTGTGLDVDFAAFGPFTSELDACANIQLVPGNPNPGGNIIACSYSAAAIENFTIPNAQTGQVYALLITNYNGDNGQILLTQTNEGAPGAGSTSCDIKVNLGQNQTICAANTTITADVNNPSDAQIYTYQWFRDEVAFTPVVVGNTASSQTIQVSDQGTHVYSVLVTVPNPGTQDPITDEVIVILGPGVDIPTPAAVTLCGPAGSTQIPALNAYNATILGTLLPADYVVEYYTSSAAAITGTTPIADSTPFTATTQTLYVRIENALVPSCYDIVPLSIVVNSESNATVTYNNNGIYCTSETTGTAVIAGTTGGTFTAAPVAGTTGTIVINEQNGQIDITASTEGIYNVTYTVEGTETCAQFDITVQVQIISSPVADVNYGTNPYCATGVADDSGVSTPGGIYTSTTGLVINEQTGQIDLAASTPGIYTVTYETPGTVTCPSVSDTAQVIIAPAPAASISYAGSPYCSTGTTGAVTFGPGSTLGGSFEAERVGGGVGTLAFLTTGNGGDIDIANSTPGTYIITYVIDETASCPEFTSAPVQVVIEAAPRADFEYSSGTYCQSEATPQDPLFDTAVNATGGTFTVSNEDGGTGTLSIDADGRITPSLSDVGVYRITNTVDPTTACPDGDDAFFIVTITAADTAEFTYGSNTVFCQGEQETLTAVALGSSVLGSFTVNREGLSIDGQGVINIAASAPGVYEVRNNLAPTASCPQVTSLPVTITINATPAFSLGGPYSVCVGTGATLVAETADGTDNSGWSYEWSYGGVVIGTGQQVQSQGFGDYSVKVTSAAGCEDTQQVTVTQNTAGFEVSFAEECEGSVFSLTAEPVEGSFNPDTVSYAWTSAVAGFVPATTQGITPKAPGTYTVTITTAEQCVAVQEFEVRSTSCMIQKGISPNGDQYNQNFDLRTLDVRHLSIFNRYGAEVYSLNNYTNQWEGQGSNGDELPTGTYYYMIERSNGEQLTGWIYINREE